MSKDNKKTKDTEALRDLFCSKRTGLGSFDKLWRKAKKEGLDFIQKEVKEFLSKQRKFGSLEQTVLVSYKHDWNTVVAGLDP